MTASTKSDDPRQPVTVWLSGREREVLADLAQEQELSSSALMRQALRLYQLHHVRLKQGETITYSGDAQRMRDFAGPLVDA